MNIKRLIWFSAFAAVVLLVSIPAFAQGPERVAETPLYRVGPSGTTGGPAGVSLTVPAVKASSFNFEICYYYPDRDRNWDRYRYRNRDWDDRHRNGYGYRDDYRYDWRSDRDRRYRSSPWYSWYCYPAFPR